MRNKENVKRIKRESKQRVFERRYPVPMEGVYAIKNEVGNIIYIGESNNCPRRLSEHLGWDQSKSFCKGSIDKEYKKINYTYDMLWVGSCMKTRLIKEIELEWKNKPKYNQRHGMEPKVEKRN